MARTTLTRMIAHGYFAADEWRPRRGAFAHGRRRGRSCGGQRRAAGAALLLGDVDELIEDDGDEDDAADHDGFPVFVGMPGSDAEHVEAVLDDAHEGGSDGHAQDA